MPDHRTRGRPPIARSKHSSRRRLVAPLAALPAPRRRNRANLFDLACERIEDLIVKCELKPGSLLAVQDLQEMTGYGRTPVHQAVSRLAADTLIIVRPRHGLQIAPIDLTRERVLLQVRRDIERFVVRLAAERSGPSHRNQIMHLTRALRDQRDRMTIGEFNVFDRRIDGVILNAAGETFLEHTLRPLHTIFRRIGWIYHTQIAGGACFDPTIDCHLAVLDAIASRQIDAAMTASDALTDFVDQMFDAMEREIDPALLDCGLESLART
jgi:DNA-binding GntR family transcriptional regulator